MGRIFLQFTWIVFLGIAITAVSAEEFEPASSIAETRKMISDLPDGEIWWVPVGEQMHWNFRNLHRFMPTVNVYRSGAVKPLKKLINVAIGDRIVDTPAGLMPFREFLASEFSTTMGLVIVHRGSIVFESYPRQLAYEKPVFWSVTKVLVSGIAAILEDEGLLDVSLPIEHYLPTLGSSSFKGILVRNILDMATGLDCPEEYVDKTSCYYRYSATIGDGYWQDSDRQSPYEFAASLKVDSHGPQGTSYSYSGINGFVIAWLVEELTGMPFQDAVTKYFWSRMGAEHDASFLAPRYGVPIAHGGLLATLRDVARFGMLHTRSQALLTDTPVFSDRYIRLLKDGGDPQLLKNARYSTQLSDDVKHNVYFWDRVFKNNDVYKGGWGGQGLLVNPDKDLVVVYTGYFAEEGIKTMPLLPILRKLLDEVYPLTKTKASKKK
jgi:CubicO group peptidase (beta-lactamase class C family)